MSPTAERGRDGEPQRQQAVAVLCSVPASLLAGSPRKQQFLYPEALPRRTPRALDMLSGPSGVQGPLTTLVCPGLSTPENGGPVSPRPLPGETLDPKDLINEPSIPGRKAPRPKFSALDAVHTGPWVSGAGEAGAL